MAPPAGFEPATLALTAPCSTTELQGNVARVIIRISAKEARGKCRFPLRDCTLFLQWL